MESDCGSSIFFSFICEGRKLWGQTIANDRIKYDKFKIKNFLFASILHKSLSKDLKKLSLLISFVLVSSIAGSTAAGGCLNRHALTNVCEHRAAKMKLK